MSTIKVNAFQDTSGNGFYPARAWVNFNGTGTVAIRNDENVASITDNDTDAIAIGSNANVTSERSIVIGAESSAQRLSSIAIGYDVLSRGDNAIAIGTNAEVRHDRSIVIGEGVLSTDTDQITLGNSAHTTILGRSTQSTDTDQAVVTKDYADNHTLSKHLSLIHISEPTRPY